MLVLTGIVACEHWRSGESAQTPVLRASAAEHLLAPVATPGPVAISALREAACSSLVRQGNHGRNLTIQKDQQQQLHLWTGRVTGTSQALPVPHKNKMSLGTKAFLLLYSSLHRTSH